MNKTLTIQLSDELEHELIFQAAKLNLSLEAKVTNVSSQIASNGIKVIIATNAYDLNFFENS
jgi:hypothetical protein